MPLTDEQIAAGWLPHDGGPCPVDAEAMVEVMCRGGDTNDDRADFWWWGREDMELSYDIIAYRLSTDEPPAAIAAEQRGREEGERAAIAEVVAWLNNQAAIVFGTICDSQEYKLNLADRDVDLIESIARRIEARQHKASERP